jgi:hypothetical protein
MSFPLGEYFAALFCIILKKEISIKLAKNIEETLPKLGQNFEGIFEVLGQVLQSYWKSSSKFLAKFFDFVPTKFRIFIRMIRTNKKFFEDANFPRSPIVTTSLRVTLRKLVMKRVILK